MPPTRQASNVPAALRKGAACLQCRKRKMRCDAGQPNCANCVKGKKDCQYAAGRAKSKTQLLREKIQDLESKIRALETPSAARHSEGNSPAGESSSLSPHNGSFADPDDLLESPNSEFHPILGAGASRSSSSPGVNSAAVSPRGDLDPNTSGDFFNNPDYYSTTTSLRGSTGAGLDVPPSSSSASAHSGDGKWWEQPEPPREIRDYLVGVFLQRNEDFHFYIDKTRFLLSLDFPQLECPHPSLLNAIYLLGCHFTNQPEWTVHEPMFLSRAREALLSSLAQSDRLFDFLMASNLVAYYLYRTGRFLEGHHQTSGASRFAVSCGLHQIVSPVLEDNQPESSRSIRASAPWSVSDMSVRRPGSMLTPPRNGLELGQRIIVFWQTYLLDKLGSAVTSLPGSLPDEADPLTEILTAWPRTLEEYELGDLRSDETSTIRNLYEPLYSQTVRRRPETLQGLHCQVTALHERALRLSPTYADKSPAARAQFWQKFTIVQEAIRNFIPTLPALQNTGLYGEIPPSSPQAPINSVIFVTHTLAQLAIIQLHNSLATDLPTSYDNCLTAARKILRLTQLLSPADFARTTNEVVLSYAWTICAQVLIRHHRASMRRFEDVSQVDLELDCVVAALENLRGTYPVVDFQLRKVADWRRS